VTTQERWLRPPSSSTMVGSAVATIVWSRAASNMPSSSPAKIDPSRRPVISAGSGAGRLAVTSGILP
jgi:hypothetical protein